MGGYFFVILQYETGRCEILTPQYRSFTEARAAADFHGAKIGVERALICYQLGIADIDIKKLI